MAYIKIILRKLFGDRLMSLFSLINDYSTDFHLYKKHSSVFKLETYEKIESEITLKYHSIEKGFLFNPVRFRFAKEKVRELIALMNRDLVRPNYTRLQIQASTNILCKYYEFHQENNIDITDYFTFDNYLHFKGELINDLGSKKKHTYDNFFSESESNFLRFSSSRCSIRNFTGEKIPRSTLERIIDLANNAPSVCNRQPVKIYVLEKKELIDEILKIQGGLKGYSDTLNQLVVLTSSRSYFYSTGERNQLYTDGGMYLMNLLYAFHYYKIGACPAHWGLPVSADKKARKLIRLTDSEQIVCLVAIGIPTQQFSTTLSPRKKNDENLFIIS